MVTVTERKGNVGPEGQACPIPISIKLFSTYKRVKHITQNSSRIEVIGVKEKR